MKSTVMHSIKWMTIARILSQLMRWSVMLVVVRLLSPSDFGIVALAETVIGFLELFTTLGLSAALIRSQEVTKDELRSVFTLVALVGIGLSALLLMSAPHIADFYRQPELITVVRVLAIGFPLTALEMLPVAQLTKEMKFKQLAIIQLLAGVAGALCSLLLSHAGFGYWALVLSGLSIQATRTIGALLVKPELPVPSFDLKKAWRIANFGGFVLGGSIISYFYVTLDIVIAGRFWTAETLGLYAVALQLAAMPLSKIMPVMKQVALPAYSKTQKDRSASRYYLLKSLRMCMGVGLPFFFGLGSISTLLVPILFEQKWANAAIPLTLLFLTMPFRMFLELHEPAVIAAGKPKMIFRNSILILSIMLPAFFIAARFNPNILAAVWLMLFPLLALTSSYYYCTFLEISFRGLLRQITPAFIASATMFFIVRGFINQMESTLPHLAILSLAILLGAIVFLGAIALIDRTMFREYLGLMRKGSSEVL